MKKKQQKPQEPMHDDLMYEKYKNTPLTFFGIATWGESKYLWFIVACLILGYFFGS